LLHPSITFVLKELFVGALVFLFFFPSFLFFKEPPFVTRLKFTRKKKREENFEFYCKNVNLLSFLACMKGFEILDVSEFLFSTYTT
jgi:hypothetical protein